ncbi:28 kDa ribonucleoprotein, chloroplastic [Typha latifolia]|uniref:28 kDa ribonucleoprotein, chloroplastic n=1 Tax=Typha latifolia TaxID=4733 RepID=UPI003C2F3412
MAASASLGSCFSTTMTPHLGSKAVSLEPAVLRIACPRATRIPSITHLMEHLAIPVALQRRNLLKISAAVAQEEAATALGEEAEEVAEDGGEGDEEVVPPAATQNTKLYFGNLPYNCDSAQLAGIIQEYASPEMVEVLYDRETGRSRGFAFVTMSSVEDCEAVIQNLDGSQYGGRTLRVNFSDKPKPKEPLYPETEYKIFVGNLSWSVTSENLNEVFQECGNVVGARVLYDGDTGRSRGYGFVCYETKEEMDAALESLNGVEMQGRAMRVSMAQGKRS